MVADGQQDKSARAGRVPVEYIPDIAYAVGLLVAGVGVGIHDAGAGVAVVGFGLILYGAFGIIVSIWTRPNEPPKPGG